MRGKLEEEILGNLFRETLSPSHITVSLEPKSSFPTIFHPRSATASRDFSFRCDGDGKSHYQEGDEFVETAGKERGEKREENDGGGPTQYARATSSGNNVETANIILTVDL